MAWGPAYRSGPLFHGKRRFAVAIAAAIGLHAALFVRSHALAHGERVLAAPRPMAVRVISTASNAELVSGESASDNQVPLTGTAGVTSSLGEPLAGQEPGPVESHQAIERADLDPTRDPGPTARVPAMESPSKAVAAVAETSPASASAMVLPAAPPPLPAGLPPAPDYLVAVRLDPAPQPLGDIEPEYPEAGASRSGSVVLRILIGEKGQVDDVAVVRSSPPGVFDQSAVLAFSKASFSPGKLLGVAVKSQVTIEVQFTPLNRGAKVSGRGY